MNRCFNSLQLFTRKGVCRLYENKIFECLQNSVYTKIIKRPLVLSLIFLLPVESFSYKKQGKEETVLLLLNFKHEVIVCLEESMRTCILVYTNE